MGKITPFIFIMLLLTGCRPWQKGQFSYTGSNGTKTIPFVIPNGYARQAQQVDSAGNTIRTFRYSSGSIFYIAHMADTSMHIQVIDPDANIPRVSLHNGALVFKGMDENQRYWREVRQGAFRVGYRGVSPQREARFDSATNYAVVWPLQ